ncbi:uncharacterized protein KY384_005735 [Bacidia gigantensis]|uniref:uncharacterized protein n=1 Tax=Bacidia gigantensis TaxID=2732470 RepID=UPI001D04E2B3|nr:uncharacterized protein KY384_005735 [Bacidia gigantensis]KAG8529100.1 hypothetical protein KY384_005735 [Bacidia gigantensis]
MGSSSVESTVYTLTEGQPQPRNDTSAGLQTTNGGSYMLLSDTQLIETLAHFSRERIPERVVHAKAAGAKGYLEVTDDISDITDAEFLTGIGKKTELITRISTVGPARGSADTVRDVRGWAIKFKTREGNNDWVFNNQPVFFIRDPIKFPSLNRSHKPHPTTNASSSDMFWDFHVHNPEGIHTLFFLFGTRGTPATLRHQNGYSNHTYIFTKDNGSYHYVKIHLISNQGIRTLSNASAAHIAGTSPDYHSLDLRTAITEGNLPTWTVSIQTMQPSTVPTSGLSIFDPTQIWPHSSYPLRKIGTITLNQNPSNYFTEIEQATFSPSNMVRGILPSADPVLQARMFAYPDAARYRLGANYQFLPTNRPVNEVFAPTQRDGAMNFTDNYGGEPNYVGATIGKREDGGREAEVVSKMPAVFTSEVTEKDFVQPRRLWEIMGNKGEQDEFVRNLVAHVSEVTVEGLRKQVYALFAKVDQDLGRRLEQETEKKVAESAEHPKKSAWH